MKKTVIFLFFLVLAFAAWAVRDDVLQTLPVKKGAIQPLSSQNRALEPLSSDNSSIRPVESGQKSEKQPSTHES